MKRLEYKIVGGTKRMRNLWRVYVRMKSEKYNVGRDDSTINCLLNTVSKSEVSQRRVYIGRDTQNILDRFYSGVKREKSQDLNRYTIMNYIYKHQIEEVCVSRNLVLEERLSRDICMCIWSRTTYQE